MPKRKSDLNRRRRSSQAFQQFVERESESQRSRRLENVRNRNRARNQMEAQVNRERHLEDSRSRVPKRKNLFREAFNYDPNFDYKVLDKVSIGLMNIRCEYCQAVRFKYESTGICCNNGKVVLPRIISPPEPLRSLLSGSTVLTSTWCYWKRLKSLRQKEP